MKKTVFMIHGMMNKAYVWDNYKKIFEKNGYKCITPTLRHHDINPNQSPPPELGTTGITDYVSDLEKIIKKLPEPPIIIGHSMGGLLAQLLAQKGLAKATILLSSAAPYGINSLKLSTIRSFVPTLLKWKSWEKPFRFSFKTAKYAVYNLVPEQEQEKEYIKMVHESGRVACQIGFWPLDFKKSTKVNAAKISGPALVIVGKKDRLTPAPIAKKIAKKYNATFKEFKNHAHWTLGEPKWEEIAEYCISWIEKTFRIKP